MPCTVKVLPLSCVVTGESQLVTPATVGLLVTAAENGTGTVLVENAVMLSWGLDCPICQVTANPAAGCTLRAGAESAISSVTGIGGAVRLPAIVPAICTPLAV